MARYFTCLRVKYCICLPQSYLRKWKTGSAAAIFSVFFVHDCIAEQSVLLAKQMQAIDIIFSTEHKEHRSIICNCY
ncbi:hypothetical protein M9H77_15296 [Catharanthus roseus]|uniref:Uncharacterized protein n=1 Tax=Catharanthus roseus TaxID=4058 RepID=A0ACC0AWV1_CATRO|nr:hypothetical protein M9H77_15296 [Catharanthus roseus]